MEQMPKRENDEARVNDINWKFQPSDLGFGLERDAYSKFFVKEIYPDPQTIKEKIVDLDTVRAFYPGLPNLIPRAKQIRISEKEFGLYIEKISFRGFVTPYTLYKSEEYCHYIKTQPGVANEFEKFIEDTKIILTSDNEDIWLPEFYEYGNMGITTDDHLSIVDFDKFFPLKKHGSEEDVSLYPMIMFCLNYENLFTEEANKEKITTDSLYKKYIFNHFNEQPTQENLSMFLEQLAEKTHDSYYNLPGIFEK